METFADYLQRTGYAGDAVLEAVQRERETNILSETSLQKMDVQAVVMVL